MSTDIPISIFEAVGSPLCVASGDGQKVYDRIAAILRQKRRVSLSFRNVSTLTSAFLNTAIGQLYGEFNEDQIRTLLKVEDMESDDVALLRRVVDTAKRYFQDPKGFNNAMRKGFEDDGDDA